jgi:iron-sulfur cluster assembly accessory protein
MITITDSAKNQINLLCNYNNKWGVKLAVKGGGCAGLTYKWTLLDNDQELESGDEIIDVDSNKFILDGASILFVIGTTLDYHTDVGGSNFVFKNPNATSKCGCGTSFGI